jgi:hypothetical protein
LDLTINRGSGTQPPPLSAMSRASSPVRYGRGFLGGVATGHESETRNDSYCESNPRGPRTGCGPGAADWGRWPAIHPLGPVLTRSGRPPLSAFRCQKPHTDGRAGSGFGALAGFLLAVAPLLRQIHLPQESFVARIATQAAKIDRNLEPRDAGISRFYRALSPLECLVLLTAPRLHARCKIIGLLGDQLLENSL